jgi:HEAT repeat protein
MHPSPVEILTDGSASVAARVMAAAELRRLLETGRDVRNAWQAVCDVAFDERAPAEVRRAAVRAIAGVPGAAQIQLVRAFTGDDDRSVRKEAIAILRTLGVAPASAKRL